MIPTSFAYWFLLLILIWPDGIIYSQQTQSSCEERAEFHILDFWLGEWDVIQTDRIVGSNRIEKILEGCAIMEYWQSSEGGEGRSLFYYHPTTKKWKQVWVTQNPFSNGGVKEKSLIRQLENGGTIFQGTVVTNNGTKYLDRTKLLPLKPDSVVQIIEISANGGQNWREVFRAMYIRSTRN